MEDLSNIVSEDHQVIVGNQKNQMKMFPGKILINQFTIDIIAPIINRSPYRDLFGSNPKEEMKTCNIVIDILTIIHNGDNDFCLY